MTIEDQKKALRKEMFSKRAKLSEQLKRKFDQSICQGIWELIVTNEYKNVHCYLPMGSEIDIYPLIKRMLEENIKVITPKTLPKRTLQNLILNALDQLEKGVFGTSHPANGIEFTGKYDLIIVPGLAFDAVNFRLGYGGGYYDKFLAENASAHTLGICYPFQKKDKIPVETHDFKLDDVLIPLGESP